MAEDSFDILLIDDEADVLLVVGEMLRSAGLSVLTAQNTERALRQLCENEVRLIILDEKLGKEDGLELMGKLVTNHPAIPVIIYSGLTRNHEQIKTILGRGASCYISKNQPPKDLHFAVRQLLNQPPSLLA